MNLLRTLFGAKSLAKSLAKILGSDPIHDSQRDSLRDSFFYAGFYKVIIKPVWTYWIQLWGAACNSNLDII